MSARTVALACSALLCACTSNEAPPQVAGGDVERGRLLLEQYACGSCHEIPGVGRANGIAGPTLATYARRVYIAGELPNQPDVLVQWIRQPHSLVPDTLMPDQNVPVPHATDMGAYLMSLR